MDVDGNDLQSWSPARINDLAVSSDGAFIVVICQEKKIRLYDVNKKSEMFSIQESDSITSLELSEDNKFLLVNVTSHEIHLWDLANKKLIQKYEGHKQSRYVIRSCFGGVNQSFVVSGSEDSQIYIWHRISGLLLFTLPGHSGTVNAVSWNHALQFPLFASCSDDKSIRVWSIN